MTKGALDAFTKTLALTVAASGVRVNSVSPATTQTEVLAHIPENVISAIGQKAHPIGRVGIPCFVQYSFYKVNLMKWHL